MVKHIIDNNTVFEKQNVVVLGSK